MSAAALEGLVAETAAGRLLPGVNRCLLRIQTPRWPDGWAAAATTHPDDDADELDVDVAFRIASVTKMVTATALLVLADQGRCRLDDPAGRSPPNAMSSTGSTTARGAPTAPPSRCDSSSITPADCRTTSCTRRSWTPCATAADGAGSPRWTSSTWPRPSRRRWHRRDGPHLHRHRLPARRAHHRSAHPPTAPRGVPRAGARSRRHGRHLAGEQQ